MPMFMDVHNGIGDATAEDVAKAHLRDLEVQEKYGVRYLTYWLNDPEGKVFCLVDAPTSEAAVACHKEAHGLIPHNIVEVNPPSVDQLMGAWQKSVPNRATVDGPGTPPDSGIRTIMFTDLEASTELSSRLGDAAAMEVLRDHDDIVRRSLDGNGGREVKHTGDGLMAAFHSVSNAVRCTIEIQERMAENVSRKPDRSANVRIGLNVGEPVTERDDFFGAAVNLAARICGHARPAQILVSRAIRDLSLGKNFPFRDQGMVELKGFPEPVRLYEVAWAGT